MLIVAFVLVAFSAQKVATLYGGCVTISVLVHYFTLVAVMWMGAEALLMFQKLVLVHVRITTKFIVIVSILCWGKQAINLIASSYNNSIGSITSALPIVPVIVPLIVDLADGTNPKDDIVIQRADVAL